MGNTFIMLVLLPALAWVICSDLLYRRIHNLLVMLLLIVWLFLPLSAAFGYGPWGEMSGSQLMSLLARCTATAVLVLLVGYSLFCLGRVGAGDVKLMAVLCLWAGDGQMVFLIVTALAGGVMALLLPMLSVVENSLAKGWQKLATQHLKLDIETPTVLTENRPLGIPYGLAIATGALYTLFVPIHS